MLRAESLRTAGARVVAHYSTALTTDSTRSVAVDLADPRLAPEQWATTRAPAAEKSRRWSS